jgi:hypothetical protein
MNVLIIVAVVGVSMACSGVLVQGRGNWGAQARTGRVLGKDAHSLHTSPACPHALVQPHKSESVGSLAPSRDVAIMF